MAYAATVPLAPGEQIGMYRIERVLGAGGMGVVYVAVDTRLGRRAAVKQLQPALSSDHGIIERFFNEAKAAASIDHPSIVEIYDVGWHTDGSAFFAMKLLDGETIGRRMRTTRGLPIEIVATIGRQVAMALAAAHARGIVHRDLKPDNIMLVRDEEVVIGERAIVLDFGIAKLFGEGGSTASNTRTGVSMGTPAYMSPEQCRGAGDVDHRTDVYAVGCILFEMLAGRPPFIAQGPGEIVGMHQFVPAPAVRSLRGDVPEALDAVVARALAKAPDERFSSMAELAAALSPFAVPTRHTALGPAGPAPAGMGATQPTMPPPQPTTLGGSRGELQPAPPTARSRRGLILAIAGLLMAGVVTIAIVAGGKPATETPTASAGGDGGIGDAGVDADPRFAELRQQAERAMEKHDWLAATVAAQRWFEASSGAADAGDMLRRAQEEAAAKRTLAELEEAWNKKQYLAGAAAFEQIQPVSVYRGRAIELILRLREHYIDAKRPEAKQLAAEGRCEELSTLQIEAARMGGPAGAAMSLPCTPKPPDDAAAH